MTGAQLITEIRRDLLESTAAYWSDTELLDWINRGQADYVNRTRLLEDTAQITMTQGQVSYALPATWLSAMALFVLITNADGTTRWKPVWPSNLEKMRQQQFNMLATDTSAQDDPNQYWIWNHKIYFNPIPKTTGQTVQMFFKAKPAVLNTTSDPISIDDSLVDALRYYVTAQAWRKEKELDLAESAKADYMAGVRDGLRWQKKQSGDQTYVLDIRSGRPLQQPGPSNGGTNPLLL